MKMAFGFISLVGVLGMASVASADTTTCKNGGDERKIEITYKETGKKVPCEVKYIKAGDEKVLWTAGGEEGYCESKAKGLAEKLGGSGFKCDGTETVSNTPEKVEKVEKTAPTEKTK